MNEQPEKTKYYVVISNLTSTRKHSSKMITYTYITYITLKTRMAIVDRGSTYIVIIYVCVAVLRRVV